MTFMQYIWRKCTPQTHTLGKIFYLIKLQCGAYAWKLSRYPILLMLIYVICFKRIIIQNYWIFIAFLFFSFINWLYVVLYGLTISRRSYLRECFFRLYKPGSDFRLVVPPVWLKELLGRRFLVWRMTVKRVGAWDKSVSDSKEFFLLIPSPNCNAEKLRPPQAYPCYRGNSLIFISHDIPDSIKIQPMFKFLLCHEIEHCTPEGISREGSEVIGIVYSLTCAAVFVAGSHNVMMAIASCCCWIILIIWESVIDFPARLEANTDMRALSLLTANERLKVLSLLEKHWESNAAKALRQPNRFKYKYQQTKYYKEMWHRLASIDSAISMTNNLGKEHDANFMIYQMGLRRYSRIFRGIGVLFLLIGAILHVERLTGYMLIPFMIITSVLLVLGPLAHLQAENYWKMVKLKLDTMKNK
jgi:hypothetical protein